MRTPLTAARATALAMLLGTSPAAAAQETPVRVKENVPAKADCFICSQQGEEHGEEKVAAAVRYRGKTYYFCSRKEADAFLKEPDAYLPAPLPRPAPAFSLKNLAGETVKLSELASGRVLLVDFWATWCGPCVKAMPELQKLHSELGGPNFSVVGIAIDAEGVKKVAPFLAKQKSRPTYPLLLDDSPDAPVWQQWGVRGLPSLLLVRDGKIIQHWTGKIDTREVAREVARAVHAANAEAPEETVR